MNAQDTKNKILTYKMVKKYFSLEEDSLKLFRERLFFSPHVNPMYQRLAGGKMPDDLRLRVKIGGLDSITKNVSGILEELDNGYKHFINFLAYDSRILDFPSHSKSLYISDKYSEDTVNKFWKQANTIRYAYYNEGLYKCFRENKINVEGEDYKLFKMVKNIFLFLIDANPDGFCASVRINPERYIQETFQEVGAKSLPKDNNLELVISLNFADWFLCSTNESWSSCLNIYAEEGFWTGLPGLIGDKNRAFLYITNGKKKDVEGIVVDKVIARRWMFTGRVAENNEEIFYLGKEYPIKFNAGGILRAVYPEETFMEESNDRIRSRYYAENLFQEVNDGYDTSILMADVYQDNVASRKFSKKNKAKYFPKSYSHYRLQNGGMGYSPIFKYGSCNIDRCLQISMKDLQDGDTEIKYAYEICKEY